ncbi:hypothetical protein [Lentzea sp. NPDC055074]
MTDALTPDATTGLILLKSRTTDITRVLHYRSGSAGSCLSAEDVRRSFGATVRTPDGTWSAEARLLRGNDLLDLHPGSTVR